MTVQWTQLHPLARRSGACGNSATPAVPWKKWGPYLSERQWGTLREDYSEDGNAWDYFSHDQARSRAYRWGRMAWPEFPMITEYSASR
jgi:hypothetical protein